MTTSYLRKFSSYQDSVAFRVDVPSPRPCCLVRNIRSMIGHDRQFFKDANGFELPCVLLVGCRGV